MGQRRKAREAAIGILYQCDIREDWNVDAVVEDYIRENPAVATEEKEFALALVRGVAGHLEEVDLELGRALVNWQLERLGYMERNILRLGAFEVLLQDFTPDKVAVDEAVEMAKHYCDKESPGLINGVLQGIMNMKAAGKAPGAPGEKLAG
ncbi:MAG: transcription antitermination factor NusB [Nitrospinota bacterium]|nr:transcription antitermination factor NusB [Nitrospinota bacterium]